MRHRIYFHITWTTRDRESLITPDAAVVLRRLIPDIAEQERANILELGLVQTHVHLLAQSHPTTAIPRLLQRLKGGTSVLVNRELSSTRVRPLRWAKGYNIDSISPKAVDFVRSYVRDQARHHPSEAIAEVPVRATPPQ